ncbi:hypothetical protein ACFE04_024777 [Oxalis oulophora]
MAIERHDYENEISLALSRTCIGGASIKQKQEYAILFRKARLSKYELPEFPIPSHIRELLEINQFPHVLTQGLNPDNYTAFFNALLMLEEHHLEGEMKPHQMKRVTMKRKGKGSVALLVPGLADRKPTLSPGDVVFAKLAYADGNPEYEGNISYIGNDQLLLRYSKEFRKRHTNETLYDIRFTPNRVNMRRVYQAIRFAVYLKTTFLFPSNSTSRLIHPVPFVPFNSNLNEEQQCSIKMILGCNGGPPYTIFGPPGTGKTSTLVEAISQVYAMNRGSRILVCSASNSAADHILEKLISCDMANIDENEILRLNSRSRSIEDIQLDLIRFCKSKCPTLHVLMRYRIIISTYMNSSVLFNKGVQRGYFSHIFLDEAGQTSEPECMVPVSYLCQKETVVVLAGDPKQLGPVIHSKNAENFGLGKSFLERLFEFDPYKNEDECYVTKLVRNYRCHPKILDLPSELFYNGELLASKKDNSLSLAAKLYFFPNKEFPILFYGIRGSNERELNNPSWFNQLEASKVVEIINLLREVSDMDEADIGVIAPYRQQVVKIENILKIQGTQKVKVGSVEQFQGQEREVIIVSTVRSTMNSNKLNKIHSLGFLSNPRRFNVAITRAKSLLIIVGNPHVICQDPYWNKLLTYCTSNKSYVGCTLPDANSRSTHITR